MQEQSSQQVGTPAAPGKEHACRWWAAHKVSTHACRSAVSPRRSSTGRRCHAAVPAHPPPHPPTSTICCRWKDACMLAWRRWSCRSLRCASSARLRSVSSCMRRSCCARSYASRRFISSTLSTCSEGATKGMRQGAQRGGRSGPQLAAKPGMPPAALPGNHDAPTPSAAFSTPDPPCRAAAGGARARGVRCVHRAPPSAAPAPHPSPSACAAPAGKSEGATL